MLRRRPAFTLLLQAMTSAMADRILFVPDRYFAFVILTNSVGGPSWSGFSAWTTRRGRARSMALFYPYSRLNS